MASQSPATFGVSQNSMIVPESRLNLAGFFNNRQYADVIVMPDDGSTSGWLCHSVILAAGSPTLSRVLSTGEYNLHQPLTLAGVSSHALESLLRFLYTSELAMSTETVVSLLDAALKLGMKPVAAMAQQYINKPGVLAIPSAARLLSQAVACKQEHLIRLILSFCESRYKEVIADQNFSRLSQEALSIFLAHHRKVQPLQGLLDAANAWCDSDQQRLDTALQLLTNQMHEMLPKQQERSQPLFPPSTASQQPTVQAQQNINHHVTQGGQTPELHQPQHVLQLSKNSMVPQPGGGWTIPITSTSQVMQQLHPQSPPQNSNKQQQFTLHFDAPAQTLQQNAAPVCQYVANSQTGYMVSNVEGPHGDATGLPDQVRNQNSWNAEAFDQGASKREQPEDDSSAKPSAKDSWMATAAAEAMNQSLTIRQSSSVSSAERVERHSLSVPQSTINSQNLFLSGAANLHGIPTLDLNTPVPQLSSMALNLANPPHASEAQPSHDSGRSAKMMPFNDGPAAGVIATAAQLLSLNMGGRAAAAKSITAALSGPSHQSSVPRRGRPTNESKAAGNLPTRGVCHIDNCYADLSGLRDYHQRFRICDYHLKVSCVMRDGQPQRFCQQCGRFHPLEEFDGNKRSCRSRLQKHNARRRKRSDLPEDSGNSSPQHHSSKRAVFGSGALLSAYRNSSISPLHGGTLRNYAALPGELTATDGLAGDNVDSDNMDDNVDPETAGLLGLVSLASGRIVRHSNLPFSPVCPMKSVPAHLVNSSAADLNSSMEYGQGSKQEEIHTCN